MTLGGFGNVAGAFVAGILIGVVEAMAGYPLRSGPEDRVRPSPVPGDPLLPPTGAPWGSTKWQRPHGGRGFRYALYGALFAAALAYPFVFRQPFPQDLAIKIFSSGGSLRRGTFSGLHRPGVPGERHLLRRGGVRRRGGPDAVGWTPGQGVLGMAAATGIGVLIGYPCFRLKGHYFAMATLVIGEVVSTLFMNWQWAGGAIGVYIPIRDDTWKYYQFGTTSSHTTMSRSPSWSPPWCCRRRCCAPAWGTTSRDPGGPGRRPVAGVPARRSARRDGNLGGAHVGRRVALRAVRAFTDPHSVFPMMLSIQVVLIAILGAWGRSGGPSWGPWSSFPSGVHADLHRGTGSGLDLIAYGLLIVVISVIQPRGVLGFFRKAGAAWFADRRRRDEAVRGLSANDDISFEVAQGRSWA